MSSFNSKVKLAFIETLPFEKCFSIKVTVQYQKDLYTFHRIRRFIEYIFQ